MEVEDAHLKTRALFLLVILILTVNLIHNLQYLTSTRIMENPQQIKIKVNKFIKSIKCKKFIKTKEFASQLISVFLITNHF